MPNAAPKSIWTAASHRDTLIWGGIALALLPVFVWGATQSEDPLARYVPTDTMRHILGFGILGTCAAFVSGIRHRLIAIGCVMAFAAVFELIQIPTPGRLASLKDFAASGVGAFAGFGFGGAIVSAFVLLRQSAGFNRPRQ